MIAASAPAGDVERFRDAIAGHLGLAFDEGKHAFLCEVMQRRADAAGLDPNWYLAQLASAAPNPQELRELAKELTVTETYFFRHVEQLRVFADVALPDRLAVRAAIRQLRVLSAGCASGEEAYSLAMLLRERNLDPDWRVAIVAADINTGMLDRAARGRYSSWALRETPPEIAQRWFAADGRDFVLAPAIRAMVTFLERNLSAESSDLWAPAAYDVIFCRNVIMYFTPDDARALVNRMASALAPGGYLFLGHAETLRGLSHDFHLCQRHDTFYYQRKDGAPAALRSDAGVAPLRRPDAQPVSAAMSPAGNGRLTWVDAVQGATDRIKALTDPPATVNRLAPAPTANAPNLGLALDLLKRERFTEALALLADLPPLSLQDPDVLLLHAALLSHSGQFAAAEAACARLLSIDDLSAGAHYVLAQCRDAAGDRQGARDHDQAASYLDPTFAMPHLHRGLMARRTGDRDTAQRELGQALRLLQTEEASRLLLFGGGFTRDSLIALCRGELQASAGKP